MATWPSPLHCYIDIWVIQSGLHPCYLSFGVISVVNSGSTAPSSFPHELPGQIISLCRCLCHEGDCPQKALTVAHVNPPPPPPLSTDTHPHPYLLFVTLLLLILAWATSAPLSRSLSAPLTKSCYF